MAANAGCYHCRKNTGGFVDMDLQIIGEGRVFICKALAKQVAKAIGCLPEDTSKELVKRADEQAHIIKGLQEALRDKEQLIGEQSAYIEKHASKATGPKKTTPKKIEPAE